MYTLIFAFVCLGMALIAVTAWLLRWEFTTDWNLFWRKWSTWLAGLNAAMWAHITAYSGSLLGFVVFIPKQYQIAAVIGVFTIGWIIPILAANIKQRKLDEKRDVANVAN